MSDKALIATIIHRQAGVTIRRQRWMLVAGRVWTVSERRFAR